jgi:hypothetical protein
MVGNTSTTPRKRALVQYFVNTDEFPKGRKEAFPHDKHIPMGSRVFMSRHLVCCALANGDKQSHSKTTNPQSQATLLFLSSTFFMVLVADTYERAKR